MTENTLNFKRIGAFELEADSVEDAYGQITERLAIHYCLRQPNKSVADFDEEILKPISIGSPEKTTVALTYGSEHSKYALTAFVTHLEKCCVLCFEACEAELAGNQALAWRYVSNAMYLLGLIEGTTLVEPAIEHITKAHGSTGARNRDAKYAGARELARKLAMEGDYLDRAKAARAIKDRVLAKAKEDNAHMTPTRAERTIYDWLQGLTFGGTR